MQSITKYLQEGSVSGGIYSNSDESGTETEELSEDDEAYEDDEDDYTTEDSDDDGDDDEDDDGDDDGDDGGDDDGDDGRDDGGDDGIERASNASAISTEFGRTKENSKVIFFVLEA